MSSETFWQLVYSNGGQVQGISNYSMSNLREKIAYARIDSELFELLKNPNVIAKLRVVLISTYLDNQPTLADTLTTILFSFGYLTTLIAC
jgi:putative restriction endonuclease